MTTLMQKKTWLRRVQPVRERAMQFPQPSAAAEQAETLAAPAFTHSSSAMLLVDKNRTLLAVNPLAAELFGHPAEDFKGQAVEDVLDGALTAIALRPNAACATTVFAMPGGQAVLATTQPLISRSGQFVGWMVTLQEVNASAGEVGTWQQDVQPAVQRLQQQVQTLQELTNMLPQFRSHQHWQQHLTEHIQQITDEMYGQLQQLIAPPA